MCINCLEVSQYLKETTSTHDGNLLITTSKIILGIAMYLDMTVLVKYSIPKPQSNRDVELYLCIMLKVMYTSGEIS